MQEPPPKAMRHWHPPGGRPGGRPRRFPRSGWAWFGHRPRSECLARREATPGAASCRRPAKTRRSPAAPTGCRAGAAGGRPSLRCRRSSGCDRAKTEGQAGKRCETRGNRSGKRGSLPRAPSEQPHGGAVYGQKARQTAKRRAPGAGRSGDPWAFVCPLPRATRVGRCRGPAEKGDRPPCARCGKGPFRSKGARLDLRAKKKR